MYVCTVCGAGRRASRGLQPPQTARLSQRRLTSQEWLQYRLMACKLVVIALFKPEVKPGTAPRALSSMLSSRQSQSQRGSVKRACRSNHPEKLYYFFLLFIKTPLHKGSEVREAWFDFVVLRGAVTKLWLPPATTLGLAAEPFAAISRCGHRGGGVTWSEAAPQRCSSSHVSARHVPHGRGGSTRDCQVCRGIRRWARGTNRCTGKGSCHIERALGQTGC